MPYKRGLAGCQGCKVDMSVVRKRMHSQIAPAMKTPTRMICLIIIKFNHRDLPMQPSEARAGNTIPVQRFHGFNDSSIEENRRGDVDD